MTKQQNDDYASMYETVFRRLSPKNIASWGLPDMVLIDGGKGQLDAAIRAAEEREVKTVVVSIAKREEELIVHATRSGVNTQYIEQLRHELSRDIFVERSGEYYIVNLHPDQRNASSHSKNLQGGTHSKYTDVTKLFQRIRDESHRFAVSYHTVLKRQKQTESILETIPGIGPATRKKLIRTFGSARGVESATKESLVEAVGSAKANVVYTHLHS
jgi:excinuclease ABC subunit C